MASKVNIEKNQEQQTTAEGQSENENSTASALAEGSINADSTDRRETQSTSELSPTNSDSETDGYVHVYVDQVPASQSEEVRNLSNQTTLLPGYLDYFSNLPFSVPSLFCPRWLQYTTAYGNFTTNTASNEDQTAFDEWVRETIRRTFTGSIEEETRFRDCLVRAISDHFDGMNHIDENLLTQVCGISREEMCYARESEYQFTRRLLLMLLRRDTKTILSVLFHLYTHAKDVVDRAISSLHRYLEEGHGKQLKCCRCLLKERVGICLIVNHLPSCDSNFLSFVNVVSEENQPVRPSVSERLWTELFNIITNQNLHEKATQLLIRVIESCGYHSDIVRMLKEDAELKRNSFICRCQESAACMGNNFGPQQERSLTHDLQDVASGPNEPRDSSQAAGTERRGHISTSAAVSIDTNSNTETCESNLNKSGDSTNTGNEKRPRNKEERQKRSKNPPKRKQPDSKTEDKVLKKKPPDISVVNTNSNILKRKEISRGNEFNGKKSRNSLGDEAGTSSFGNCNLQMEFLKIGVSGYENQPDSGVCLPSTSSEGDSGVYDNPAISLRSVDHDEETASKQIDNDLRPSTLKKADDQSGNGDVIKTHTSSEEEQENMLAGSRYGSENLSQVQTDQSAMEEICSAESLNSSADEQSPNGHDDSDEPATMMP